MRHIWDAIQDQKVINQHGNFHVQLSLDFSASPFEAAAARIQGRQFIYMQRNLNDGLPLRLKALLSNRIQCISQATKDVLTQGGVKPSQIKYIPYGIDLSDINFGHQPQGEYFLMVGSVLPVKRIHLAIQAFEVVAARYPQLELWIAGAAHDPAYHKELTDLIERLQLGDKVRFLGLRSDVFDLMRSAEALVHCARFEAFGWVIVEAMAVGLPVIAADEAGPSEIIADGETGYLVSPDDPASYADAMLNILRDPESNQSIKQQARKHIETSYTVEAMIRGISDMILETR